mmetsp:Transcript_9739/g.28582  ORF Transcript_9739/g.28582 Transcript_9739/m.28582 type:complete len:361 (+) Transcript_9739:2181-3263(+)
MISRSKLRSSASALRVAASARRRSASSASRRWYASAVAMASSSSAVIRGRLGRVVLLGVSIDLRSVPPRATRFAAAGLALARAFGWAGARALGLAAAAPGRLACAAAAPRRRGRDLAVPHAGSLSSSSSTGSSSPSSPSSPPSLSPSASASTLSSRRPLRSLGDRPLHVSSFSPSLPVALAVSWADPRATLRDEFERDDCSTSLSDVNVHSDSEGWMACEVEEAGASDDDCLRSSAGDSTSQTSARPLPGGTRALAPAHSLRSLPSRGLPSLSEVKLRLRLRCALRRGSGAREAGGAWALSWPRFMTTRREISSSLLSRLETLDSLEEPASLSEDETRAPRISSSLGLRLRFCGPGRSFS